MERRTLTSRVETLEKAVDDLRQERSVIDAVDTRTQMIDARTQALEVQFAQFLGEVRMEFSAVHEEFGKVRDEIRQGDEETRRFVRILHEDLVGRIAVLGEQSRRP